MSYGTGPYGTSGYGTGGAAGGFQIVRAYAVSAHEVFVALSAEPQHMSQLSQGDALNPSTWSVIYDGNELTVLAVAVDAVGPDFGATLYVIEGFPPYPQVLTVAAPLLRDVNGNIVDPPGQATFFGLGVAALVPSAPPAPTAPVDLENRPVPSDVTLAGTLVMTAGGDYAVESGSPLLKKLVLRRLFTDPGGFFHLPNYGLGLRSKRTIGVSSLPPLKREIETQVQREPEVESASASLALSGLGILDIRVRAKVRTSSTPVEVTATAQVAL